MKREKALSFFTSKSGLSFTTGNVEREAPAIAIAMAARSGEEQEKIVQDALLFIVFRFHTVNE